MSGTTPDAYVDDARARRSVPFLVLALAALIWLTLRERESSV